MFEPIISSKLLGMGSTGIWSCSGLRFQRWTSGNSLSNKLVFFSQLFTVDEGGWESQEVLVSSMGCSALSWCPYRPNAKDSYRIAVAAGDSCIHIYRCYSSPSNAWNLEVKLRGHTDRVRHLAWCPFIGITTSFIASCGRVSLLSLYRDFK